MHRLERNNVPTPPCLINPPPLYKDVYKEEIRQALLTLQETRCAYCERLTGDGPLDGHIEHFRKQADYPALQCAWSNMFWSCNDTKTCGKHKDICDRAGGPKRRFLADDIIDPSCEDPERLLLFVTDGTVRPKEGLTVRENHRAEETLRVFQLNESPFLRKSREDAVKTYIGVVKFLVTNSPDLLQGYIQSEISNLTTKPFETAIKSFFESYVIP